MILGADSHGTDGRIQVRINQTPGKSMAGKEHWFTSSSSPIPADGQILSTADVTVKFSFSWLWNNAAFDAMHGLGLTEHHLESSDNKIVLE